LAIIMKTKYFLYLSMLFISCQEDYKRENFGIFWVQKTLDEKYKIYSYFINTEWAFTSETHGTKILKLEDNFFKHDGQEIKGEIVKWISKDTLEVNRFERYEKYPKDTLHEISYEKVYDITVKTNTYKGINAGGKKEYYFENLDMFNNKLQLNNVERILGKILPKNVELSLGNIKFSFANDTLTNITWKNLEKSMDLTYYNGDGTYIKDLPLISSNTYYFIPQKKYLKKDLINKKGIYYSEQ